MEYLVDNLKLILEHARSKPDFKRSESKPRLLVFDSGCHDLAFNNSAIYFQNFHVLHDILKEIKDTEKFTIIYQNIPPWPPQLEHDRNKHINTFVVAATAYWIKEQFDMLGIPVINLQKIALPFADTPICGMHYLCNDFPRVHKGHAGQEAAQQLLGLACKS